MIIVPSDREFQFARVYRDYYGFKFSMSGLTILERAADVVVLNRNGEEIEQKLTNKEKTIFEEDTVNQLGMLIEDLIEGASQTYSEGMTEIQLGKKCYYLPYNSSIEAIIEIITTQENERLLNQKIIDYISVFYSDFKLLNRNKPDELW
jgi:hypothetical protein